MASFTMPLKRVIKLTDGNIGLSTYPIFDPSYREGLNKKIREHYWNREIGLESVDMFRFNLARKMNEIMPLYNQLYLSTQLSFDPFKTVDLTTLSENESEQTTDTTAESETNSSNTGDSRTVSSETPQTILSGDKDYATAAADAHSASQVTGAGSETATSAANGKQTAETTVSGYQAMPSDLLQSYRATMINVDMMIVAELSELFMLLHDTGDEYTRSIWGYGY